MTEGVNRGMHFGAFLALIAIVAGTVTTFGRGLQGAAIEDDGGRLCGSLHRHPQNLAQIVRHGFKTARLDPALRLLMHRIPRRQVVGDHPPGTSRPNHVTQRVEESAQSVITLRRLFFHQGQIRSAKGPLLIAHIARVIGPGPTGFEYSLCHPKRNAWD